MIIAWEIVLLIIFLFHGSTSAGLYVLDYFWQDDTSDEEGADLGREQQLILNEELAADQLASTNTCYSPACIPRIIGLTVGLMRLLFLKIGQEAAASLIDDVTKLPHCQPKLNKVLREKWTTWNMVAAAPAEP